MAREPAGRDSGLEAFFPKGLSLDRDGRSAQARALENRALAPAGLETFSSVSSYPHVDFPTLPISNQGENHGYAYNPRQTEAKRR